MSELLSLSAAESIPNKHERIFALALIASCSDIDVFHQHQITSFSGRRKRATIVDFMLLNSSKQKLFVEIAGGNHKTNRKGKQQKTACLAGLGETYAILYGSDVLRLEDTSSVTPAIITAVLCGKYNGKLFSFYS